MSILVYKIINFILYLIEKQKKLYYNTLMVIYMALIKVNNLSFKYKDRLVFEKLNFNIKPNTITTIIGKNGSGKTTLIKLLTGLLESNNKIKYNDLILNKENKQKIIGNIKTIFENSILLEKTVKECLIKDLDDSKKSKEKLNTIKEKLDLNRLINKNITELNNNEKWIVLIASALITEPKILMIDGVLSYIDAKERQKVLDLLLKLKSNTTIIITTHDIEDTIISDKIIVLDKNKILLNGSKETIYKEEKQLNDLGFKLPFMVELSNRLKFYDLIDNIIYDMEEMVDVLWQ